MAEVKKCFIAVLKWHVTLSALLISDLSEQLANRRHGRSYQQLPTGTGSTATGNESLSHSLSPSLNGGNSQPTHPPTALAFPCAVGGTLAKEKDGEKTDGRAD